MSPDPSRRCPECARLSELGCRGPRWVNRIALVALVGGVLFALFSWALDLLPFLQTRTATLPPLIRVGHYLAQGAFFGVVMSWFLRARLHASHTDVPPQWISVFWPRILVAIALFVVALFLIDLLL